MWCDRQTKQIELWIVKQQKYVTAHETHEEDNSFRTDLSIVFEGNVKCTSIVSSCTEGKQRGDFKI
jgi:hypothetical protein